MTYFRNVREPKFLWVTLTSWFISSILLFLYMPVETPSKPLDSNERVYFRRKSLFILTIECIAVLFFLKLGFVKVASAISMSISFAAFLVLLEALTKKTPTSQGILSDKNKYTCLRTHCFKMELDRRRRVMIRIAVCDDSREICVSLENMLLQYSEESSMTVKVDLYTSGEEFMDMLKKGSVYDVIFLDIELNTTTGLEVSRVIRHELDDHLSKIVFITSKTGYERQLFAVQPLDFLAKPLRYKEVVHCANLALKLLQVERKTFDYKKSAAVIRVAIKDILYFEAKNKQIFIRKSKGGDLFYDRLEEVKKRLPSTFVQIHRSFLVNFDKVKQVGRTSLLLVNDEELPIGQTNLAQVRKMIYDKEEEKRVD